MTQVIGGLSEVPHAPFSVTFTGADDNTNIQDMIDLSNEHSIIEFGILYSKERQGTPRYPSMEWIEELTAKAEESSSWISLALHVCGKTNIENLLHFREPFPNIASSFTRVQLNFMYKNHSLKDLTNFMEKCTGEMWDVIIQDNDANEGLEILESIHTGFGMLQDSSGGRGVTPGGWRMPKTGLYGFAGGLGPDNILEHLPTFEKLMHESEGIFWIDMETKLRDAEDKFSLDICRQVISALQGYYGK